MSLKIAVVFLFQNSNRIKLFQVHQQSQHHEQHHRQEVLETPVNGHGHQYEEELQVGSLAHTLHLPKQSPELE